MDIEIGFLGFGRMARAISGGLTESGLIPPARQMISGRDRGRLENEAKALGLTLAADNRELVRRCRVVVLGVKPAQVVPVLEEVAEESPGRLIISLAAGISLQAMGRALPARPALVRSMPNVAVLAGRGATLICAPPGSDPAHLAAARKIFESVGRCWELDERLFDAGGAINGSGPAYFFTMMESLVRGGVRLGLPWDLARELVLATALGSAELAWRGRDDQSLAGLRDMVTSPGGTTAEALLVMEKGGLGGLMQEALAAAAEKSKKLG